MPLPRSDPISATGLRPLPSIVASKVNRPDSDRPMPRISFTTSLACSAPRVPASAPKTPAWAQLGTASSDGAAGKMQRRQGWSAPCQAAVTTQLGASLALAVELSIQTGAGPRLA